MKIKYKDYLEAAYAGFLGMNVGIRIGAPVEPTLWTYERIRSTYGDITGYVKDYKQFAADDDANGPVYFLRALRDDARGREITPGDVEKAWLNYTREGIGMFWWGGYGVSTEHTAYLNLKHGIHAPQSGSKEQNGTLVAEQIGGQIFIDTWGLIFPGNPKRAAASAGIAASVSHDGNGLYGARFIAACIALAFVKHSPEEIILEALSEIPEDSAYARVVSAVLDFYRKQPDDWRACRDYLTREWGYDKYGGVCHIIPNAGVCVLSMLYGEGRFDRTVEIAAMCGWDTDCNAGNVGTVLGVMTGPYGIPKRYREPINDIVLLSGISGDLNILDIPTYVKELAETALAAGSGLVGRGLDRRAQEEGAFIGEERPAIDFDFSLPGSTHGMRVSDPLFCRLENVDAACVGKDGRCLKILFDRMSRGERSKIYYKPYYRRRDLSDERYSPVFTPKVYSGQQLEARLFVEQYSGWEPMLCALYCKTSFEEREMAGPYVRLVPGQWHDLSWELPDTKGDCIEEIGIILEGGSPAKSKSLGFVYMDHFLVTGKARYFLDFKKQTREIGNITPFSMNCGAWDIDGEGRLSLLRIEEAFCYGGSYYEKDYEIQTAILPRHGDSHLIHIRSQGAQRGYLAGFIRPGKVGIYRRDFGLTLLGEGDFSWELHREYAVSLLAKGEEIVLYLEGKEVLRVRDAAFSYGMFGCGALERGRTSFGSFRVRVL